MEPVLRIDGLTLTLPGGGDRVHAVQDLSLAIAPGELLCLVGESGSGKSMTALAVTGLLPAGIRPVAGTIRLAGSDLLAVPEAAFCRLRGRDIGTVFQEPMTSLNPVMRVGDQIAEPFRVHARLPAASRRARVLALLDEVGLPDPERIARAYPHELSGGQRQRVMIAGALALEPKLLVADEPTTALDVTTQKAILALVDVLRRRHGTAVLMITHDFGVVAEVADTVAVMRRGVLVESGRASAVLHSPSHAYTRALLAAVPRLHPPSPAAERPAAPAAKGPPALSVDALRKAYRRPGLFRRGRAVQAVADVSFTLARGETLGLVGESGSGKSTAGRCAMRLIEADAGRIVLGGTQIDGLSRAALQPLRPRIQAVFQDPFASLNPRRTALAAVADGLLAQGVAREEAFGRARRLMALVGLPEEAATRFPHEFSGGQRQRICIARALAPEPAVLVADEPVSALDVSIQAQILDLLRDLQRRLGLSILFITHDLRVAARMCDRIAVMQAGRIVETGNTAALFARPRHPYTRALLDAIPGRADLS